MRSPRSWVVVTAADRAAATFAACGGEPLRPHIAGEGVPPQRIPFSHLAHPPCADTRKADGARHQLLLDPVAPSSHAARPRRLCQPPWTQPTRREPRPTLRRNHLCRSSQPKRQPLFGREGSGGRGASLREAASPPRIPPSSLNHFYAEFFADLGAIAAANAFRLVADALAVFDMKGSLAAAGDTLTAAAAIVVNHQAAGLTPRPR